MRDPIDGQTPFLTAPLRDKKTADKKMTDKKIRDRNIRLYCARDQMKLLGWLKSFIQAVAKSMKSFIDGRAQYIWPWFIFLSFIFLSVIFLSALPSDYASATLT